MKRDFLGCFLINILTLAGGWSVNKQSRCTFPKVRFTISQLLVNSEHDENTIFMSSFPNISLLMIKASECTIQLKVFAVNLSRF